MFVELRCFQGLRMRFFVITVFFICIFLAQAASATPQNAAGCVASLNGDARRIYDEGAPKVAASIPVREAVKSVTRGLVMNGHLSRSAARPAAEAAGQCLQLLVAP